MDRFLIYLGALAMVWSAELHRMDLSQTIVFIIGLIIYTVGIMLPRKDRRT